jgi:hypothetical protein
MSTSYRKFRQNKELEETDRWLDSQEMDFERARNELVGQSELLEEHADQPYLTLESVYEQAF